MCVFSILNWLHSRKYKLPKSCGVHLHFQAVCKYDFFSIRNINFRMVLHDGTFSGHLQYAWTCMGLIGKWGASNKRSKKIG